MVSFDSDASSSSMITCSHVMLDDRQTHVTNLLLLHMCSHDERCSRRWARRRFYIEHRRTRNRQYSARCVIEIDRTHSMLPIIESIRLCGRRQRRAHSSRYDQLFELVSFVRSLRYSSDTMETSGACFIGGHEHGRPSLASTTSTSGEFDQCTFETISGVG
jgi:hypothetical protein